MFICAAVVLLLSFSKGVCTHLRLHLTTGHLSIDTQSYTSQMTLSPTLSLNKGANDPLAHSDSLWVGLVCWGFAGETF